MKRIKIAQIGVEHDHASDTIMTLRKMTDVYEVVGWCDPEETVCSYENGKRIRAGLPMKDGEDMLRAEYYKGIPRYTLEELWNIPGLEAVTIETSETNLTKYAQMAADHGLHVHMDKPGGFDAEEFRRLIDTFRKNGNELQLGYMYRYNPEVIRLLKEIDEGLYGEIYSVECHMDCYHAKPKRDWLKKYKGGMMFFLGCHLVDLIYRIQGEPEEVIPMNRCTGFDGAEGEDVGFAVLKYPRGVSFAKTCAAEPGGFMRRQLVVCGEKGTTVIEPLEAYTGEGGLRSGVRKVVKDAADWGTDGEKYMSETFDRYMGMMDAFASYIRHEKVNPYDLDYEEKMYRLMLRCCGI